MSLVQSRIKGPLGLKRYHSPRKSDLRPRFLKSASFSGDHHLADAVTKLHGNDKPQTPGHYNKRLSFGATDILKEPHKRPWSAGGAPGRKHAPEDTNPYHWVWLSDMGRQGKWTRREKMDYYAKQDRAMRESKPHNETMVARNGPAAHWWALSRRGAKVGGYDEKLDVRPPRQTGLHLKHGMYKGAYENVKPYQYVNQTGRKNEEDGTPEETVPDTREMPGHYMGATINERNWRDMKWTTSFQCDVFRPLHTDTCTEMGIYYTHR